MGKEHTHVVAEVELLLGWTGEAKMNGVPKDGGRSGGHHLLSQEGLAACGHVLEIVFHQEGFDGRPRGIEDGGLMINLCEKGWERQQVPARLLSEALAGPTSSCTASRGCPHTGCRAGCDRRWL